MKSFAALLTLACAASAATITPRAECKAQKLLPCAKEGVMGCEKNGGHSMKCEVGFWGALPQWKYETNCPDQNAHCDCATGLCVPN